VKEENEETVLKESKGGIGDMSAYYLIYASEDSITEAIKCSWLNNQSAFTVMN